MSKNLINILKYFGNKDFEKANSERQFTIPEMLSIMMHSREVSVTERVEDMKVLASHANEDIKARIERCIASELKKLNVIKSTKAENTTFDVCRNNIAGRYTDRYSTFDEAIESGVNRDRVFVTEYYAEEHRSVGIADFYVKDGKVTQTFVVAEYDNDVDGRECAKTEVSLHCPFKPFDLIAVGGRRYIVANLDTNLEVHEQESSGWLNVTLPVYNVGKNGNVTIDVVHSVPWNIADIFKVNAKYLTLADMEEVEYIKEHLA